MGLNFYTSLSGIKTAEHLISVAQNNISNANNPSYARQRAEVVSSQYGTGGRVGSQIGSGSLVNKIERITDNLLIQYARTEKTKSTEYGAVNKTLKSVEVFFNEMGDNSINNLTAKLFDYMEEASKFPEQTSYRVGLSNVAGELTSKVSDVMGYFDETNSELDSKIQLETQRANELISQIAEVNKKMSSLTTENPNSLLDERDRLLDELTNYVDVSVKQGDSPGDMDVYVGGKTVVSSSQSFNFKATYDKDNGEWITSIGDVEINLSGGSLKGNLDTRNITLPGYEEKLDHYVQTLSDRINEVHREGYGLDGSTGQDFFTGNTARTFEFNQILKNSPGKIGLSGEDGVSGNSDIAQKLIDIQNEKIFGDRTISQYYQEFTVSMSTDLGNSIEREKAHNNVYSELEANRQSVQGVNVDDELLALESYQHFYQANAKALKVVDDLLTNLLSLI